MIILSAVLQREKVAAELHVAQREISHGAIILQLKIGSGLDRNWA